MMVAQIAGGLLIVKRFRITRDDGCQTDSDVSNDLRIAAPLY